MIQTICYKRHKNYSILQWIDVEDGILIIKYRAFYCLDANGKFS